MTISENHTELQSWGEESATLAVIAVHGRGQNPNDMRDLADRIDARGVRYFAPEAPGNSWYPGLFLEPIENNQPSLDTALAIMEATIDDVRSRGFDDSRIVLWGFSQGACLLSHLLLTRHPRPAAAVLFTGGHVGAQPLVALTGDPLADLPVLMRSISHDPWVPPTRVAETADLLTAAGASVDLLIADGDQHIVTDEATATARALFERLGAE